MSTTYARRVKFHEARRHFLAGGAVLVSEHGHETTCPVTDLTNTHTGGQAEWDALVAHVRMWRNRYPHQRFYVVPMPTTCTTCSYPYSGDACPNPACPANPALSDEHRAALVERHEAAVAEAAEREQRMAPWGRSITGDLPVKAGELRPRAVDR